MIITLSTNASGLLFEYPHYYLNRKEEACKARLDEWVNKSSLKNVTKRFSMWVWEDFPKTTTTFLTPSTYHVAL